MRGSARPRRLGQVFHRRVHAARRVRHAGGLEPDPQLVADPAVAAGQHADHFFLRRAYVDVYGACLDGPGVLAPTAYEHWFVDQEIIGLADARGVFTPCLESVVEHHHPGYDGREDLRAADPTYMRAVAHSVKDEELWETRRPLVEGYRQTRGRR
jgi:hypothetical protein